MKLYGLIGFPLEHSFSKLYFSEKFKKEGKTDFCFENFSLQNIEDLIPLIKSQPNLLAFSVTKPHKETILPYLETISEQAKQIQAVNSVRIQRKNNKISLHGYNTDFFGFKDSLLPLLKQHHKHALILGTGGAAKAVAAALDFLNIEYLMVSRYPKEKNQISYSKLDKALLDKYLLIINATPLGTMPNTQELPNLPYRHLSNKHLLFDLIYNPAESLFLQNGKKKGAAIKNGLEMLHIQAKKSWKIWTDDLEI